MSASRSLDVFFFMMFLYFPDRVILSFIDFNIHTPKHKHSQPHTHIQINNQRPDITKATHMLGITYNHQRNRRANKLGRKFIWKQIPLAQNFLQHLRRGQLDWIFFFTSTHQELTLLILLLSKKSQKEQKKKGESGFGFELIIC